MIEYYLINYDYKLTIAKILFKEVNNEMQKCAGFLKSKSLVLNKFVVFRKYSQFLFIYIYIFIICSYYLGTYTYIYPPEYLVIFDAPLTAYNF